MKRSVWIAIGVVVLLGAGLWFWNRQFLAMHSAESSLDAMVEEPAPADETSATTKRLFATSIDGVANEHQWSAIVPQDWQAEAVDAVDAINLYDPSATGESNLEQSQLFLRFFKFNRFLTLDTVTIHQQSELTINDRPAIRYDIEKKSSMPDFANQPSWRSARHIVTDVRASDDNPSVFYVIAKRPDLDQAIYDQFLKTLQVIDELEEEVEEVSSLVSSVDDFLDRITLKPFGILIDPTTSPVQPERFSGYHTGVDAEFTDTTDEVEVQAVADGEVTRATTASGYGGVIVVEHEIDGTIYQAVYGHVDPADLPAVGSRVEQGQRIGHLGTGETAETDGERKHLHFALFEGSEPNLRGYVSTEAELDAWLDPVQLFE